MSDAQKTKRQEQIENTRKQEAERLRVLATKMEEELLDIHGEVPSPELMWQMIRRMGLELDDVKDTLDEKLVSAWLQWWRERHVFVQRALLFMPFLIVFEGLDLVRLNIHLKNQPLSDFTSSGILNGLLPMIWDFMRAAGGG